MHCFNTGSLCYLSVDVFENWIYLKAIEFSLYYDIPKDALTVILKKEVFFEYIYPVTNVCRIGLENVTTRGKLVCILQ